MNELNFLDYKTLKVTPSLKPIQVADDLQLSDLPSWHLLVENQLKHQKNQFSHQCEKFIQSHTEF